ncbi:MAG: PD-(D/E)XK nuclease family protein, partial [Ilumatobacteraceae bacterium]
VGPLSYALGQTLDLVIVLGATEGQLPSPPPGEPLLGDADRLLAGGALAVSGEWLAEQRCQLVATLAAASHAVLISPRGDLRATAVRQPSRWIEEITTTTAATSNDGSRSPALPTSTTRSVASFAAGVAAADFPATVGQHHLRSLARHVRAGEPIDSHPLAQSLNALRDGLRMVRARQSAELTEFDGDLSAVELASPLAESKAISPTRLEHWLMCPFGYFVEHVLHVKAVEERDDQLQITAIDQGNLIHETLDRFHHLVLAGELPQPGTAGWTDIHRVALLQAYDSVTAEFADAGRVGKQAFWMASRVKVRNWLLAWLETDGDLAVARRAKLLRSEFEFGLNDPTSVVSNGAFASAAEIVLPGGRVAKLRGKVDRIDLGTDGTLYVTDHKSGSARSYTSITDDDPTAHGTKLQLAAYAAAAVASVGQDDVGNGEHAPAVHAEYSFIGTGHPTRRGATFTEQTWEVAAAWIAHAVDGIESGLYFGLPDKSQFRKRRVTCEFCDPDHLGTLQRYSEFELKRTDPRVARFLGDDQSDDAEAPS